MGFCKDQMIEQMQEEREDLEITLDEIEVYGKRFKCTITKDVDGQIVHRTEDEQRRICRSQEARGLHHANQQRNSGISRPRHGVGKGENTSWWEQGQVREAHRIPVPIRARSKTTLVSA
ncbi:hypothetical protein F4801DRAFT_415909 [Xylaria longipes]|nr:hypothetical protein F4801DRAFT_415909 [Xylaria longipes]